MRCAAVADDSTADKPREKGPARRSGSKGKARGRGESAKPASGGRFRVWEVKLPWQEDVGKVTYYIMAQSMSAASIHCPCYSQMTMTESNTRQYTAS